MFFQVAKASNDKILDDVAAVYEKLKQRSKDNKSEGELEKDKAKKQRLRLRFFKMKKANDKKKKLALKRRDLTEEERNQLKKNERIYWDGHNYVGENSTWITPEHKLISY